MSEERTPVSVTIKCQHDGFGFDLTAELIVGHIPGLVAKLKAAGITPANSPYVWQGQPANAATPAAPVCKIHGVQMKPSKHEDGAFFCSAPIGVGPDGKKRYCSEKASLS